MKKWFFFLTMQSLVTLGFSTLVDNHPLNKTLHLQANIGHGRKLVLSDDSSWIVCPNDLKTSRLWIFPAPLKIVRNDSSEYSYTLVNLYSKNGVHAKKFITD